MMFVKCPACGKYAEKEVTFRVGDKVKFVWQTATANHIRITSKTGKVTSLGGGSAVVRSRGKDYLLGQDVLSPVNEPSSLTVMMVGICQCAMA